MPGGGGPDTQTVTQTSIPKEFYPYFEDVLDRSVIESERPYESYGGQRVAGFSEATRRGFDMAMDAGMPEAYGGVRGVRTKTVPQANLDAYINPYVQNVIDRTKSNVSRDYARIGAERGLQAAAQGSFGGSRHGIADYLAQEQEMRQLGDIQYQGLSDAYDRAVGQFQTDEQRRVGVQQFNRNLDLAKIRGQEDSAYRAAEAVDRVGSRQDARRQEVLDKRYEDYLARQNWTRDQISFLSSILRGTPVGENTTTSNYSNDSSLGNVVGAGLAAYGGYRATS